MSSELIQLHKRAGDLIERAKVVSIIKKPMVIEQAADLQQAINGRLIVELRHLQIKVHSLEIAKNAEAANDEG